VKSSIFGRSIELARLAARVGIREFRSGDLKSRIEQAVLIANSLSRLKGAAMKAGQLLSLDLNNYFPPEAIQILSQLQNQATAQPFDQMQGIVKKQLGASNFKKLSEISNSPIGIASIGQVHRARYNDQDIVLKVQYPGVADSIDSDLKILKILASSFCQMTGRKMNLDPLFQEFRNVLSQEVDYLSEAKLQTEYSARIEKIRSDTGFHFHVPRVIDELSTAHVLAMTFEQGSTLKTWIGSNPSQVKRDAMAHAILDLYFHEFFDWGLVQTDPNWANFLVRDIGDKLELILLDFGATRRYSQDFIRDYILLLHLSANGDSEALKEHAIQFGLLDKRESKEAFFAFQQVLATATKPFFTAKAGQQKFDFSDPQHAINSANAAKDLAELLVFSPPPYGLAFLHRKLGGVYSVLKSLEVKLDISGYWEKMSNYSKNKAKGFKS
jgi:aarF domain-containing kinase